MQSWLCREAQSINEPNNLSAGLTGTQVLLCCFEDEQVPSLHESTWSSALEVLWCRHCNEQCRSVGQLRAVLKSFSSRAEATGEARNPSHQEGTLTPLQSHWLLTSHILKCPISAALVDAEVFALLWIASVFGHGSQRWTFTLEPLLGQQVNMGMLQVDLQHLLRERKLVWISKHEGSAPCRLHLCWKRWSSGWN